MKNPEYIFETSWEVCNRVGGIYAVLSTRAAIMQREHPDKVIFFGPDFWTVENPSPFFKEDNTLLNNYAEKAAQEGLSVRVGRWDIPGQPIAILLKFQEFLAEKDTIYAHVWEHYQVKSHAAYGDYDESCVYAYTAGRCMGSVYNHLGLTKKNKVCAHFNEWQTAFGLLYIKEHLPQVATLFTTHATGIGRSIAGNQKPLYDYMNCYNGDQMAEELNMVSKHSAEKQAAHYADCFTTVSKITDIECRQLLQKPADVLTPNGFEADFVPKGAKFTARRTAARKTLRQVAETLLGYQLKKDTLFVCTSGRYEYKNKGINVFVDAMKRIHDDMRLEHEIVAFVMVPGWIQGPREDLQDALKRKEFLDAYNRQITHQLMNYNDDDVMKQANYLQLYNFPYDRVKLIFVPSYLNGNDGIFNKNYYDLLIGMDLTIFPSYYEPWGYTPMESVAFGIPTITTSLAGFGQWAEQHSIDAKDGVGVIHRSDYNYGEVVDHIASMALHYFNLTDKEKKQAHEKAMAIAEKALWEHFFAYYKKAYDFALSKK